ncbi:MAG: hypothetical protein ABIA04_00010 [Pseudomonadota bacterium]
MEAYKKDDYALAMETLKSLGIKIKEKKKQEALNEFFIKWCNWFARLVKEEFFDFAKNKDYMIEGIKLRTNFFRFVSEVNNTFIFYERAFHGLYRILHKLAQVGQLGLTLNIGPYAGIHGDDWD